MNDNEWFEKVKDMPIDEYNEFLNSEKDEKFKNACSYLDSILDSAYENYIIKCKRNKQPIDNTFFLHKNEYGLTSDLMLPFYSKDEITIQNYKVKYVSNGNVSDDYLRIEKNIFKMIGYKGFEEDLTCNGSQYKIGETYTFDGQLEFFEDGFHFCKTLGNVLNYYDFNKNHRFCEVEILGDVIEVDDKYVTNKIKIVKEIEITANILSELAKDKDLHVRRAVAQHPNTDGKILSKLVQDEDEGVRIAVADNPHTSVKDLSKLAQDKSWLVRKVVARNPHTNEEDLSKLAQDAASDVRKVVARNPHTNEEDLSKLAQDAASDVRYAVASNPHTSVKDLSGLLNDFDKNVREAVLENPNPPLSAVAMYFWHHRHRF